jgi:hypothetical protein
MLNIATSIAKKKDHISSLFDLILLESHQEPIHDAMELASLLIDFSYGNSWLQFRAACAASFFPTVEPKHYFQLMRGSTGFRLVITRFPRVTISVILTNATTNVHVKSPLIRERSFCHKTDNRHATFLGWAFMYKQGRE